MDASITTTVPRNRWKRSDVFGPPKEVSDVSDKRFVEFNALL